MEKQFKIGDVVEIINESVDDDKHLIGMTGTVVKINVGDDRSLCHVDFGTYITQQSNSVNDTTHTFKYSEIKYLAKKGTKIKKDDLVRYMAFGTGCNNKSDLYMDEDELKTKLKNVSRDSSWSGRIIGYKLVPLYEAIEKTTLKLFKTTKVKRLKKE